MVKAMTMASGALAWPSFIASKDVVTGTRVRDLPLLRPLSSLKLRLGSEKVTGRSKTDMGRSSNLRTLRSGNSALAKLAPSRWNTWVRSALQADVIAEENDLKQTLEKLKEQLDIEGGNSKVADDKELLRFLRTKSLDIEATAKAVASHQKWREEFIPKGYFTAAELQSELESKKAYWIKKDKKGRPALLTIGRNHIYNKKDFEEFKRFIVFFIESLIREAPPDTEEFICIVDLKGLGFKNLDSKSFITAAQIFQSHYPRRLDKVFMINVPAIFNGLWKIVKPFLEEEVRNKVIFVDKNKTVETLTSEIDLEYLPAECGGTAELVPLEEALSQTWPQFR